jgi:hypothetical protein|tara:strand:+ start:5760 stop:6185 length:426 start_codon:yes stop_codon:yes gene_type:complete
MTDEQVLELIKNSNQNKFSNVLLLPLGDSTLDTHIEQWLLERVNVVKMPVYTPESLEYAVARVDYALCTVDALKCVLDASIPMFINIHTNEIDIVNKDNRFVFDPFRNEPKVEIDYTSVLELATKCLKNDLDKHWIPYYEV